MSTGPTESTRQSETDAGNVSRRHVLRGAAAGLLLPSGTHAQGKTPWQWVQTASNPATAVSDGDLIASEGDGELTASEGDDDSTATEVDSASLTVMTRNLYVGANLFRAFAKNPDDISVAVGSLLRDVRESRFEARAEEIADEIATARPDLVGLQEVALLRVQRPGDYETEPGITNATDLELDFLAILSEKLAERRLPYEVVSSITNVDIELPADVDAGRVDVRLTDRDVILAHESVTTRNPQSGTYNARIDLPFPRGVTYPLLRGYCTVDAEVDGVAFTFVNTHLESVSATTQLEQARELLVSLSDLDGPVVLVGDFNSPADGDGTVTYGLLTRFFTDAYAEVASGPGYTCCQKADLRAAEPRLGRRIDFIFYRGGRATSAERVGIDPTDRVGAYVHGDYRRLWPSDHAGVVVSLELDSVPSTADSQSAEMATGTSATAPVATLNTSETATATALAEGSVDDSAPAVGTSDSIPPTDVSAPGLGVVSGLAGLAAAAVALARRRRQS